MSVKLDDRLVELDLHLPPSSKPVGLYKPVVIVGDLLYVSGHGPLRDDGSLMKGKVGQELTAEEAKLAARQVGLAMLATMKEQLGSLNRVKSVVKVLGMVNSALDFEQHPSVINGFSELMADVFGPDNGVGARSAVGMILPFNVPVEIEAIFELIG